MAQAGEEASRAVFSFNEEARRDISIQQDILATRGVIGRLVGFSARKGSLRDWVQVGLSPSEHL